MGREYWIVEEDAGVSLFSGKRSAEICAYQCAGEIIHVREVVEDESPTQPTELEMHRADHAAAKAAGFECVGELLAAYKVLLAKPDHAAALADALEEFLTASWVTNADDLSAMLRYFKAVDAARSAIDAYRASLKF